MSHLRILYITELYPDFNARVGMWGGGERHFYELSTRLAKAGHDVTVLTCRFPGQEPESEEEGVKVRRFGLSRDPASGGALKSLASVADYLVRTSKAAIGIECDLIHCNAFYPVVAGRMASVVTQRPMISTFHDVPTLTSWNELTGSALWATLGYEAVMASVLAAGRNVIAVSQQTRRKLIASGCRSVDVIPNGVDLGIYGSRHDLDGPRVLYVGRLVRYKRVDVLISAFREVTSKIPGACLTVVGDGPERHKLEKLASSLPGGSVNFTGALPSYADVAQKYRESSLFVLPSVTEGESIVVKEAMAAGLPVIAMRVAGSGVLGVVSDGRNGSLVEPDNPHALAEEIVRILTDRNLRDTLGSMGRRVAEKWTWNDMAERVVTRYLRLLRRS